MSSFGGHSSLVRQLALIVALIAALVPISAGALSAEWYGGANHVHDRMPVVDFVTELRGPGGESRMPEELVSFSTEDGGIVYANVYGTGDRGVVLAHGARFNKESWAEQAPVIAAAGFRVVVIDFRGRGQSRGGPQANADNEAFFDVMAAVRYLRDTGARTVGVVGASFGGWAAAEASIRMEAGQIDRVVLLAHSLVPEPELIKGAKLFIVARDDPYYGGEKRLAGIRDQYERATEPKELVVLDGDAHAQFIFETDEAERLMEEILRFLSSR